MPTIHLYLKSGYEVLIHSFNHGEPFPAKERLTLTPQESEAWIQTQLARSEVRAIYACAGTPLARPQNCRKPWAQLAAGHPAERL